MSLSSIKLTFSLAALLSCVPTFLREEPEPPLESVRETLVELRNELEWPGRDPATAGRALVRAEAAWTFVRDEVSFVDYDGCWAGAEAALRTRIGNATDKALLLEALLRAQGQRNVRLVRAPWPDSRAPYVGGKKPRSLAALTKLVKLLGRSTPDTTVPTDALAHLRDEVERSLREVQRLLAGSGFELSNAAPKTRHRDWVWVQMSEDGRTWTDLDPTFPNLARPVAGVVGFVPKPCQMTLHIESLGLSGKVTPLLRFSAPTSGVLGYDVNLAILPAVKNTGWVSDMAALASVDRWRGIVQIGPMSRSVGEFQTTPNKEPERPTPSLFGGGPLRANRVDTAATSKSATLRLRISFENPMESGPRVFTRLLNDRKVSMDPLSLVSWTRVAVAMGGVPVQVVESRIADELIDLCWMRHVSSGQKPPTSWSSQRGIASRTARVFNTLLVSLGALSRPGLELSWQGPGVFLENVHLERAGQEVSCVTRLDLLNHPMGPSSRATPDDRVRWGLATCAVEAWLLGGTSVNRELLEVRDLQAVRTLGPDRGPDDILQGIVAEHGIVLRTPSRPVAAWGVRRDGELLGVLAPGHASLQAKGSEVRHRSQAAGSVFGALGSGAMAALGAPSAMLVTGLVGYFGELAKAFEGAAGVLNRVAFAIETGDTRGLVGGDQRFQDLARHLLSALGSGLLRGYAESLTGAGLSHVLPGGSVPGGLPDRVRDGLLGTGLSLIPDPPAPTFSKPLIDRIVKLATTR